VLHFLVEGKGGAAWQWGDAERKNLAGLELEIDCIRHLLVAWKSGPIVDRHRVVLLVPHFAERGFEWRYRFGNSARGIESFCLLLQSKNFNEWKLAVSIGKFNGRFNSCSRFSGEKDA